MLSHPDVHTNNCMWGVVLRGGDGAFDNTMWAAHVCVRFTVQLTQCLQVADTPLVIMELCKLTNNAARRGGALQASATWATTIAKGFPMLIAVGNVFKANTAEVHFSTGNLFKANSVVLRAPSENATASADQSSGQVVRHGDRGGAQIEGAADLVKN